MIFFSLTEFEVIVVPSEITTTIGKNVVFNCTVEPLILLETVSISWTKVTPTGTTFLTSMRTLYLKNIQKYDAGEYTCTGESGGKTSEDSGTIIIKGKFLIGKGRGLDIYLPLVLKNLYNGG